jgi:hypothetical protein
MAQEEASSRVPVDRITFYVRAAWSGSSPRPRLAACRLENAEEGAAAR